MSKKIPRIYEATYAPKQSVENQAYVKFGIKMLLAILTLFMLETISPNYHFFLYNNLPKLQ